MKSSIYISTEAPLIYFSMKECCADDFVITHHVNGKELKGLFAFPSMAEMKEWVQKFIDKAEECRIA